MALTLQSSAGSQGFHLGVDLGLVEVGKLAGKQGRGVVFLFDEAHTVFDDKPSRQFPLGALLSAFIAAQDDDDE